MAKEYKFESLITLTVEASSKAEALSIARQKIDNMRNSTKTIGCDTQGDITKVTNINITGPKNLNTYNDTSRDNRRPKGITITRF